MVFFSRVVQSLFFPVWYCGSGSKEEKRKKRKTCFKIVQLPQFIIDFPKIKELIKSNCNKCTFRMNFFDIYNFCDHAALQISSWIVFKVRTHKKT